MMSTKFNSAGEAAAYLRQRNRQHKAAARVGLGAAVKMVETDAKAKIGEGGDGWAPLADSTIADKARRGFATPAPLLRTSELRDSISSSIGGDEGTVGSDSQIAIFQELGTRAIPPRSFLESTAVQDEEKAVETITKALLGGLL